MKLTRISKDQLVVTAVCVVLGLLLASCDDSLFDTVDARYSATAEFSHTFNVANQTWFRLEGINGSVEIIGVEGATTVEVWGEREVRSESTSDAEAHLPYLQVVFSEYDTMFNVETEQPEESEGRIYNVDYHCRVPDDMMIAAINVNGDISLAQFDSTITVILTNGDVSADTISDDVLVVVVNGNVTLMETLGEIDVGIANGNVVGKVALLSGGSCDVGVVNGNIDMSFPVNTSADLTATVGNGSISAENLVLNDMSSSATALSGRLGSGDGQITLSTVNGTIIVRGY